MKGFRTALALGAALLVASCGGEEKAAKPADPAAAAMAVSLAPAESATIERTVLASGAVAPWEEMQLGVELTGVRVTAMHVDVGQHVKAGQLLLEVDHRTLDAELAQSTAALNEAQAGVELAKVNLGRGQALTEKQLISARDLDELRAGLVQAEARLATTKAQRDASKLRRDFAELRAPDDGIISARLVEPGQIVSTGTELLRLIRDGRLEWRAELAEADLMRVQPGAKVELRAVDGSTVSGVVRAVTPGVDPTKRTGTIYADLPEPGVLRAGAFVEGRIVTGAGSALMVPNAAVVQRDGYPYVFTVDKGIVKGRRVQTGAVVGDRTEILDGLAAGEAVVSRGAGFLSDGDRVRVVADAVAATPPPRAEPAAATTARDE